MLWFIFRKYSHIRGPKYLKNRTHICWLEFFRFQSGNTRGYWLVQFTTVFLTETQQKENISKFTERPNKLWVSENSSPRVVFIKKRAQSFLIMPWATAIIKHALGRFAAECEAAPGGESAPPSVKPWFSGRKTVDCSLRVAGGSSSNQHRENLYRMWKHINSVRLCSYIIQEEKHIFQVGL